MDQMRLHGIPASITLAQGIIESADGQSRLARLGNNHFGIKASQQWIANGGQYGLHSDDKPNEKFCYYASVGDSYEHHSQVLLASRYSACHALAADDYKGWAQGLQKAGYATDSRYASTLTSVIERNNLQRFDQMVIQEMAAQGLKPGEAKAQVQTQQSASYSFPLKRDEFLFISSPFGNRVDPMDHSCNQFHKGVDIRCNYEALFATENNGRVIATSNNAGSAGGKSVTVEYDRDDGTKYRVFYCHLSSVDVNVGDTVNAGQQVGVSGNTGTRTTGPHLHMGVKSVAADGNARDIDPCAYLAEIAQRGNIQLTAMSNGKDLLAKYKADNPIAPDAPDMAANQSAQDMADNLLIDTDLSPEDWMKKLLSSEDSGVNISHGDPIMDFVVTAFTSLMALAVTIDNKSEEEAMAAATDAALNRTVDLTSLVPSLRQCTLSVQEGGKPVLNINDGNARYSVELNDSDINRLNIILNDSSLSPDEKQGRVSALVGNIALSAQMSQSYQQGIQQGQQESLTMK